MSASLYSTLYRVVLGTHPHNSFCSFNWHNVRHVTRFFARRCADRFTRKLVVADLGSGASPYFEYFAHVAEEYIAIDSIDALPVKEERKIRQLSGTLEHVPLNDCSVDVALCNQVLEHVVDPQKSMAEIFRILKPGGVLFGSVPHVSPVHLEPHDYRRFTTFGVRQLLQDAGFNHVEIEGNGGVFSAAAFMVNMDLLLSPCVPGRSQHFKTRAALILAPIVGGINLLGWFMDLLFGNRGRTPSNLCWEARKETSPASSGREINQTSE